MTILNINLRESDRQAIKRVESIPGAGEKLEQMAGRKLSGLKAEIVRRCIEMAAPQLERELTDTGE